MRSQEEENQETRIGQCGRAISRKWRRPLVLLALFTVLTSVAFGQLTTADILGTVNDASGAVVPNASVTLTNLGTGEKRTAQTNGSGDYDFALLPVGHYSIVIKAPGFEASITNDLSVEAGDRARDDAHLVPGAETITLQVSATTPLLQADNVTVSSTVTAKAVQDLPLDGRNFVQLVQLVPGANEGPGNGLSSGGRPDDRRQSAGFSVNGQDDVLNNFTIDGIDDNERIIGTIGVRPNVEGIQEISVQTNNYAPEAGRTAGGVVALITKSGTNTFHGSIYEYFRNDIFDARSFFSRVGVTKKPELRQNQFGGSVGGPIFKNKTFFFFDYEGLRQVTGSTTYTNTVPTLTQYDDIHSLNGGTPQALVAQGNGTGAYPIDPIALNYLMLYPAPNVPGAVTSNYISNPNKIQNSNVFDARIDHQFNASNSIFGHYTYNKVDTFIPPEIPSTITSGPLAGIIPGGAPGNYSGPATDIAQQPEFNYTHIFSPALVLDLKAGYTYINNLSLPLNYLSNADTTIGFGPNMNFNAISSLLTPAYIGNFATVGDGTSVPLNDIENVFQYLGTVSWNKGNHNIKIGAGIIRRQARTVQSTSPAGTYTFGLPTDNCSGAYVGGVCPAAASTAVQQSHQLASMLVGAFTTPVRSYNLNPPNYRTWEPSGYIQDSWAATPKLTLVYGIRYDIFTPFTETRNQLSNFDFTQAIANLSNPALVNSSLKVAGRNGVSNTVNIATVYSNIAPRVGFAYSAYPRTVVRGGYGLSYYPSNLASNASLKNAPFVSFYNPSCNSQLAYNIQTALGNPLAAANTCAPTGTGPGGALTFDDGLPIPSTPDINNLAAVPSLSFVSEYPRNRPGRIYQFNLQVEQQFGYNVFTIGYVGSVGQHLPQLINDVNLPPPNAVTTPSTVPGAPPKQTGLPRPLAGVLPNLKSIKWLASEGVSNYDALQTSFQRRFAKGLAFDANYTWGHGLNDAIGYSEGSNDGFGNADPTRIRQIDYGNADNDIRNRFAVAVNYEIPFGQQFTGLKRTALAGWQVNSIAVWQSGKDFSILNGGTGVDGPYQNRALPYGSVSPGFDRPNTVGTPNLATKSLKEYFNTAAYAGQALGTVGNTPRNSLYGPHFRHVDLSLFKNFPVTERVTLQFRAEAYNISNTPSFFIANTRSGNQELGNGAFGTITSTDPVYTPRQYQFALKAQF
jgi:Carboxypeptidase regulatory-like domain/TonB dependent receptor